MNVHSILQQQQKITSPQAKIDHHLTYLVLTTMTVAYHIGLERVAKVVDEEASIASRAMALKTPKNLRNTTTRVIMMMETIIIALDADTLLCYTSLSPRATAPAITSILATPLRFYNAYSNTNTNTKKKKK